MYKKSIFIFRRDLRLQDNRGLIAATKESDLVIPLFIFDPIQVGTKNNYRSKNAMQFMAASLKDLNQQLKKKGSKLYLFYGDSQHILKQILRDTTIEAVYYNKDYTPFSIKRDADIGKLCKQQHRAVHAFDDALLHAPKSILKKNGEPYSVFTPFWKTAKQKRVPAPQQCRKNNFFNGKITNNKTEALYKKIVPKKNHAIFAHGGTIEAKKILLNLKRFKDYLQTRDIPSLATTGLSAHNKFGTVSIRQVYYSLQKQLGRQAQNGLMRQLYWRDFYYHIAYHWPSVFGASFQEKYRSIKWRASKKDFERWCTGTTGFPIVDAGMRQMNKTGWMHNRVRMIVASFLTKDLLINWLWGEQYFATQLVDYDPCVNNGNWQWAASTGCDAQPYFRIFNPWLQQKKFDPDCVYIKTWVKELKNIDSKIIHTWYKQTHNIPGYPDPMVNHAIQREKALALYKAQQ